MSSRIPLINLQAQFADERDELMPIIERVMAGGMYVLGDVVREFEDAVAAYCGVSHAISLNSGTDALVLAMAAAGIGPGDEVITPSNSFVASTASIAHLGATPVFCDVLPDQNIDPADAEKRISNKTKAIMPVHLTGRMAAMDEIMALAKTHGLTVIEDSAQAIGSKFDGEMSGSIGDFGCFSTHPLKNLNGCGDGGFVTTDDNAAAEKIRLLRNHGLADRNTVTLFGHVSRMDSLQAAILAFRLKTLDGVIATRCRNARIYQGRLNAEHVFAPPCREQEFNTFHTFVVQVARRGELMAYLDDNGIDTAIHYPVPIHLQPVARDLGYPAGSLPVTEAQMATIMSLPINQYTDEAAVHFICDKINAFFEA